MNKNTSAFLLAVSCNDVFAPDNKTDSSPLLKGHAFTVIKAVQAVNKRLVGLNESDTLLFEVILLGTDCEEHIKTKIADSATHYGLEIGKFCFCSRADLAKTLQANHIKLFLSTDREDVYSSLQAGIPAAFLYKQTDQQVLDQLRVLFSGDLIGLPEDSINCLKDLGFDDVQIQNFNASKGFMREFAVLIGNMRRRFGHEGSPLRTSLMTVCGSNDVCVSALKTLRDWGVEVDEAYCLAGAPDSPILSVLQPHILWDIGLQKVKGVDSLMRVSSQTLK
ncbi:cytosolic 5'-nucleotidase 1A [Trichomycterus rosablanca]|uniref:cytosolic 5'-nucleotidase 1A n=1 Tax=Trichomycterus rosablanca TaxID=2290929 RepID=UPI002F3515FB